MKPKHTTWIHILALSGVLAPFAAAQTPPFSMRLQLGQTVSTISDGATITLAADAIGARATGLVVATYTGTTAAPGIRINSVEYAGSTDLSVDGYPDTPFYLTNGQSFNLNLYYKASTSVKMTGRITVYYTDGRVNGTLTLNLNGTAPEFAFTFVPPGGNSTVIMPGGKILFPPVPVDTSSSASFTLINRGSGAGAVGVIAVTGAGFQLVGAPLPNTVVDSGKELKFSIQFTPSQTDPMQGSLSIMLPTGQVSFALEGSGTSPYLEYETVSGSTISALLPGESIPFGEVNVGDKTSVVIRVSNTGNADYRLTAVTASGAAFTVTDAPFLPYTLTPGDMVSITVTFTPTQSGRTTGRLRIGGDYFELAGVGLAPSLTYSYAIANVTTTVSPSGTVVFTPVAVGSSSEARFLVSNTGTAPASINSISITGAGSPPAFVLGALPALPATIQPGSVLAFVIAFQPSQATTVTATLKLDTQSFTLSGAGNPPPPLPAYRFEGASGVQEPLTQPAVGLTLASPYPVTLNGTLTLTFNSDVGVTDPALQFAVGGRTVNFVIPANTTRAVFANNLQQVRLQTGTVAGVIVLTPSFTTDGGINVTPTNPPSLNLTIPQLAPRLLSVQISARTSNSLTLLVTGYATGRSVTSIDLQFTPTQGENVKTQRISIPAEASFLAWYTSTASQAYGSLFTATIPLTFAGDVTNVTNLADTIQSVTVTLSNRQGTSSPLKVDLH